MTYILAASVLVAALVVFVALERVRNVLVRMVKVRASAELANFRAQVEQGGGTVSFKPLSELSREESRRGEEEGQHPARVE